MKAVLFDLDDTLVNYSFGVDACWRAACRQVAEPAGYDVEALVAAIEDRGRWFWSCPDRHRRERTNMPRAWGQIIDLAFDQLARPDAVLSVRLLADFQAHRWEVIQPLPRVHELLGALKADGVALGMVTNGDAAQQREKIRRGSFADYFDCIVIEGEFGRGKPDAEVFQHALDALRVEPGEAVMVGDKLRYDVVGAKRVGLRAVWIDREGTGLPPDAPATPDHVVTCPSSLVDWHDWRRAP